MLAGIRAAQEAGLEPVKINSVLLRGINDDGAADLLAWTLEQGLQLRFIEQMPLDEDRTWTRRGMVTAAEIRQLLSRRFRLDPRPVPRAGARQSCGTSARWMPSWRTSRWAPWGSSPP